MTMKTKIPMAVMLAAVAVARVMVVRKLVDIIRVLNILQMADLFLVFALLDTYFLFLYRNLGSQCDKLRWCVLCSSIFWSLCTILANGCKRVCLLC